MRLYFVNSQQSTVNVCLIFIGIIDTSLRWETLCSQLTAKKSVVRCLLSVDFSYLCKKYFYEDFSDIRF